MLVLDQRTGFVRRVDELSTSLDSPRVASCHEHRLVEGVPVPLYPCLREGGPPENTHPFTIISPWRQCRSSYQALSSLAPLTTDRRCSLSLLRLAQLAPFFIAVLDDVPPPPAVPS